MGNSCRCVVFDDDKSQLYCINQRCTLYEGCRPEHDVVEVSMDDRWNILVVEDEVDLAEVKEECSD